MNTIDSLVRQNIATPGDPVAFVVQVSRLPEIPDAVHHWLRDRPTKGLYLVGDHGVGKTWVAVWVALELGNPSYWSEKRFVKDTDKLRWYERTFSADAKNDALWSEFHDYELAYSRLQFAPILVVDELFYWNLLPYQQDEIVHMLRNRFTCMGEQHTICCSLTLPEVNTPLDSLVRNEFTVVEL